MMIAPLSSLMYQTMARPSRFGSVSTASGGAVALNGLRPAQTPRDQGSVSIEWNRPGMARAGVTAHPACA